MRYGRLVSILNEMTKKGNETIRSYVDTFLFPADVCKEHDLPISETEWEKERVTFCMESNDRCNNLGT